VDNYVEFWTVRKAEQRNLALLGKHERLSAISTIKRFAHEEAYIKDTWEPINPALRIDHRFPSTSSIAAAPFKYAVLETLCNNPQDNGDLLVALQAFIAALLNCCDENKTIPVNTDRHPARNLFFTKHGNFNPEYFPMIQNLQGLTLSKGNVSDHEDLWATQFMCIDGDYLFEDTLIPKTISEYMPMIKAEGDALKRFEKKRLDELKPKVVEALKALKKFIGEASALGIPRPQPYVVVLSMDGDEMGKTLGVLQNARDHKRFSETLANFAKTNVQRIVEEEHLGRVVYAGGDDVLALLPVRDALQIAEALRSEFQETVGRIGITNHEGKPVTASTGLAYVHHTHNLQDAVRAANNAQSVAKEKYNRNAVAVEFLRRSGESRSMGFQWQTLDDSTLSNVIALTAEFGDGLSRSLPYDLAQMAYSMGNESVPEVARFAELTRVIRRRLPERNRDKAVTIAECVLRLINPHGKLESRWHNAQHWLELARFIAQTTVVEED